MENTTPEMPATLYQKLNIEKLDPRCAFLSSVGEDDCASVKWMLDYYPTPPGKNKLDCFSIYSSGIHPEYFTPMTVATECGHKYLRESLLAPLALITHHVTSSSSAETIFDQIYNNYHNGNRQRALQLAGNLPGDQAPYFITGYKDPFFIHTTQEKNYPLCLAACSKKLALHSSEISRLNFTDHARTVRFLLLTTIMNNDTEGLNLIKKLMCCNVSEILDINLGLTFVCVVGTGKYQSTFNSENEIRQFINYPILKDKKQVLLEYLTRLASDNGISDNAQIKKAKEIIQTELLSEQL